MCLERRNERREELCFELGSRRSVAGFWVPLGEQQVMLVLSRKKNESIVIDDTIIVTVVEIRGDKVRLGIQAPKEVPVHRSEVHAAIHNQELQKDPPAVPSAEA